MSKVKSATASQVRAWCNANGVTIGERGRIAPAQSDPFNAAHKGKMKYDAAARETVEVTTVPVKVTTLDKAGRKATITRIITNTTARDLLGQVDADGKMTRGRYNHATLSLALSAQEAENLDFSTFQPV